MPVVPPDRIASVGGVPVTEDDFLKREAIKIAQDHRRHCEGAQCNVSLFPLCQLLEKAGIELTTDEVAHFM